MSRRIQFRRGTAAELATVTPLQGQPCWTTDTKKMFVGDGATAGGVRVTGDGTVTHTGGVLTSNRVVLGAGTDDAKVVSGIFTDGTSKLTLGQAGTSVGGLLLANVTSGSVELRPVVGALGTSVISVPAVTSTLAVYSDKLNVFAATTSAELAAVLSDEVGSGGGFVRATSPTFTTDITTPKVIWTTSVFDSSGSGSPESVVTANIGSVYRRTNGGTSTTLYVKESGTGNTGWVAHGGSGGGGGTPGGSNTQLQYNNSSAFGGISGITTDGTNLQLASTSLVGMGVAPATYQLYIKQSGQNQLAIETSGSSSFAVMRFITTSRTFQFAAASSTGSFYVYDDTTGAYRFVINSSGRVLLGGATDDGSTTVQANGTFKATSGITGTAISGSTGSFTTLVASSGLNSTAIGNTTASTGAFTTLTTSSDATFNANVGIGATPATHQLLISSALQNQLAVKTTGSSQFAVIRFITTSKTYQFASSSSAGSFYVYDETAGAYRWVMSTAGLHQFNAYGAGTLTTDASGNITATSDKRLKVIHGSFDRGLAALRGIKPVLHSWTKESGNETKGIYAGFIAQNVKKFIPEAVGVMNDGRGLLTLSDRPILATAINAILELDKRVSRLENSLN